MATTTAKKTVAKVDDETVENTGPIIVKSSGVTKERVTLFQIDDVDYTVPAKPGVNITLKFLNEMRKTGNEMFAALGLLEAMLGVDAYNELLEFDELDDELLGTILEQVVKLAMERVEESAGK